MTALDQLKSVVACERQSGFRGVVAIWVDWRDYRENEWSFSNLLVGVQGGRDAIATKLNAAWESEGLLAVVLRASGQVTDACTEIDAAIRRSTESMSSLQRLLSDCEKPIALLVLANQPFPADGTSPDYEMQFPDQGVPLKVVDHGRALHARIAELTEYDRQIQSQLGLLQYYLQRRWPEGESNQQRWSQALFSALNLNPRDSRMLAGLSNPKGTPPLTDEEREMVIQKLRNACGSAASPRPVRVESNGGNLVNWISHADADRSVVVAQALRNTFGQMGLAPSRGSSIASLILGEAKKADRATLKSDEALWTAHQTVLLVSFAYRWGNISAHKEDYDVRVQMSTMVGVLRHEVEHARYIVGCWKR